jgi:hypothetical protein
VTGWDWGWIAGLGAFHGVNPAMGWLFALALGLQQRSRRALALALVPIALGHEAAVGLAVLLIEELRVLASDGAIRIAGAAALAALAAWRIARSHRHPRWVGMRLRPRELALWSFLMSSAHGAGVMLFPFVLGVDVRNGHGIVPSGLGLAAGAVLLHGLVMIAVAGAVAALVYEVVGVGFLRRGWVDLDRVWAYALAVGAVATLLDG